jgi:hypothetical protein
VATPIQVVIDCADPASLAPFWAAALGYVVQPAPEGFSSWEAYRHENAVPETDWNALSAVVDPDGAGPRILFQRVPEPKSVKNRVHVDINAGGPRDTPDDERRRRVARTVERLETLGATTYREFEERGDHWVVDARPRGQRVLRAVTPSGRAADAVPQHADPLGLELDRRARPHPLFVPMHVERAGGERLAGGEVVEP